MPRANRETSALELCERLLQAITQYHGTALQADDVTLVAVAALCAKMSETTNCWSLVT